jgi:putative hydrolase of the HAD superfamily
MDPGLPYQTIAVTSMTPSDFDAIAFDIDGTLYPNYRFYLRVLPYGIANLRLMWAFNKTRKMLHHPGRGKTLPRSSPAYGGSSATPSAGADPRNAPLYGTSVADKFYKRQAEHVAAQLRESPAAIKEKIQNDFYGTWQEHFKKIKPFPHVRQTIEKLRRRGFKTAVMSDFPIGNKLKFMHLDGLWDVELCTEELGALKPALKPFQELALALESPPEKILYVGNSVRCDITGAKDAGMRAALIRRHPGFSGTGGADFIFRDYRQLEQYIL